MWDSSRKIGVLDNFDLVNVSKGLNLEGGRRIAT